MAAEFGFLLLGFELRETARPRRALAFEVAARRLVRPSSRWRRSSYWSKARAMRQALELGVELLELAGLGGLALDDAQAALGGVELLARAGEVGLGALELALGLDAARLYLAIARGLFEDRAALLRAGQEHRVDLALLDDRVGVGADAGVQEQFADVACRRAPLAVDQVLARAVAVEPALDLDDVGVDRQAAPCGA